MCISWSFGKLTLVIAKLSKLRYNSYYYATIPSKLISSLKGLDGNNPQGLGLVKIIVFIFHHRQHRKIVPRVMHSLNEQRIGYFLSFHYKCTVQTYFSILFYVNSSKVLFFESTQCRLILVFQGSEVLSWAVYNWIL